MRYDLSRRRMYIAGRRLHHGLACLIGVAILSFGIWHDRRDFPWLFKKEACWCNNCSSWGSLLKGICISCGGTLVPPV